MKSFGAIMKKNTFYTSIFMLCCLCLSSCENKDYYKIDMNTDYKDTLKLEDGNGNKTKVVLLLGQSNASGCSYNDYLKSNTSEEEYQNSKMVLKMF